MLMQNFKAADDLGITEPQKEALMKTLVLMETGKLKHEQLYQIGALSDVWTGHFNMEAWTEAHPCGTVCCIGGTAELVGKLPRGSLDEAAGGCRELSALFYPEGPREEWRYITPTQAARALRSYLTTGDAKWSEAINA